MTSVDEIAISKAAASANPKNGGLAIRALGPLAVALALLSALVTFLVLTGLTPISPNHRVVVSVLLVNLATALILLAVIGGEVWQIIQARRYGRAGARLHVRIVGLFSVIAAVPAILVAIVASITLDRGLDRWFSTRTQAVIENSLTVAQAYLREHAAMIRGDILAMSYDFARVRPLFEQDRERFRQFMNAQASIRGLPYALLMKGDLSVIERITLDGARDFPAAPSANILSEVKDTEPQIALLAEAKTVAAIIKLGGYDDTYLYVARPLDPRVVEQLQATQESVAEYRSLGERRLGVQIAFGLMYTVIALILLLSAVWIGLNFANRLVAPIRRLIGAANQVSKGNLYVQVPVHDAEGDLSQLGETFNTMTDELRTQRDDLMRAHDLIDSRRRFTEAVLAGASAGVVGVDSAGRISILNRSAERLIAQTQGEAVGRLLVEVVPELTTLFGEAQETSQRLIQGQVTISRDDRERNLSIRVTTEQSSEGEHGYVITLDDITDLVTAQRTSAWADIARRIAHEIKNPLTPIQLSAERLRRKYGSVITEDRAIFEQCTDTIVRQVDDIKRMVDEFSRFARMPKPVIASEDVADTVRQVAFLMRVGNPEIEIDVKTAEDPMPAQFDRRLISQALTNIIKNASEAIEAVPKEQLGRGEIHVSAMRDGAYVVIDVIDNGGGLPKENRSRLLEPYVTTREKGTGLGLAIVGRILEEHGGRLELNDAPPNASGRRGAWARLQFAAAAIPVGDEQTPKLPEAVSQSN
ncbi:MAG TPA: PAS domain-containing sensor histidine kinase [Xanthobacteraceae bacterium]|nr:PAS domain-containing sensor histidine kinase [Xanthobacteraceae bacterium]